MHPQLNIRAAPAPALRRLTNSPLMHISGLDAKTLAGQRATRTPPGSTS